MHVVWHGQEQYWGPFTVDLQVFRRVQQGGPSGGRVEMRKPSSLMTKRYE
jgi:hypothetical protein